MEENLGSWLHLHADLAPYLGRLSLVSALQQILLLYPPSSKRVREPAGKHLIKTVP